MFENLNWWEIGALLLVALLIFGDRLPKVIGDGLRMLRNLRNMAQNATGDLSRELGTDIQLEDLHPKAFIRKHLLSEEDEAAIRNPIQGAYDKIRSDLTDVRREVDEVASAADIRSAASGATAVTSTGSGASAVTPTGTGTAATGTATPAQRHDFDLDAT